MTKFLTVIIVILTAILVGIILYPQIQENRPQNIRFTCDSSVAVLPLIVGIQDTLFEKNRILPQMSFYTDPDSALKQLLAGSADIGIFPWSTVFKAIATRGETLKTFMAVEFRPALPVDALVKPKKSKIKTLLDLKGKRLGYPPIFRDYIPLLLAAANIKTNEIKISEVPMATLTARLAAGEFDAVWVTEPFISPIDFTKFDTISGPATRYIASPFPGFAVGFSNRFFKNTTKTQRTRLKIAFDLAIDRIDGQPAETKARLGRFFFGADSACVNARLPQFQKLVEINKPAIQALASRMLATGILTDTISTSGIFVQPAQLMR